MTHSRRETKIMPTSLILASPSTSSLGVCVQHNDIILHHTLIEPLISVVDDRVN